MLKKHEQVQIQDMLDSGIEVAEIAKRLGHSLGSIYKYKKLGRDYIGPKTKKEEVPAELLPYVDIMDKVLKRRKPKLTDLYFKLQRQGYKGNHRAFEIYCKERKQVLRPKRSIINYETSPGQQAQVDWAHFGTVDINGKRKKVYLFAYILSYSRATYYEFVIRQNQRTLQECHIHAFTQLGIPKEILYDNMKTVVSRREKLPDGTKKVHYTPAFLHFANYYQFEPLACAPYYPQAKGKVEKSIQHVRGQFLRLNPRIKITLTELNTLLSEWVNTDAMQRIHSTTREKPYQLWLKEKQYLTFTDKVPPYNTTPFQVYHTNQFGLLVRQGIVYNLGSEFARMKLEVYEKRSHGLVSLDVYRNNILAITIDVPGGGQTYVDAAPKKHISENRMKGRRSKTRHAQSGPLFQVQQRDLNYYSLATNMKGVI